MTTELKIVEVAYRLEPFQWPGDPRNYTVTEAEGWDLGRPIGNGDTLEAAMNDFRSSWELTFDEEIDVLIIDKL